MLAATILTITMYYIAQLSLTSIEVEGINLESQYHVPQQINVTTVNPQKEQGKAKYAPEVHL